MHPIPRTELLFVRHGEPELSGTMLGWTDSPLTLLGWQQLERTFQALPMPDVLVSSPLSRCAEFARRWSEVKAWPLSIDECWKECHFGDWDGLTFQEIAAQDPEALAHYYQQPAEIVPPGGESLLHFTARIEGALAALMEAHRGKTITVLCHSGVIRTVLAWCLKMDVRQAAHIHHLQVDYASVTKLRVYHQGQEHLPQLVCSNWTDSILHAPASP